MIVMRQVRAEQRERRWWVPAAARPGCQSAGIVSVGSPAVPCGRPRPPLSLQRGLQHKPALFRYATLTPHHCYCLLLFSACHVVLVNLHYRFLPLGNLSWKQFRIAAGLPSVTSLEYLLIGS